MKKAIVVSLILGTAWVLWAGPFVLGAIAWLGVIVIKHWAKTLERFGIPYDFVDIAAGFGVAMALVCLAVVLHLLFDVTKEKDHD